MNRTYETNRRGVDKIVLFGLFIAALLIAYFIVVWRSSIALSEPIELDFAGLSVSIPTGNGWQNEKQWQYQQNAFTLGSFFNTDPGSTTALVSCRYLLAATRAAPDTLFEEKASAIGEAKIAKTGQIKINEPGLSPAKGPQKKPLTLNWAHIKRSKMPFDTFFGFVQLSNNRRLDIEVYQATGNTDLAEEIFKSVAESLKFTDTPLLDAGGKIVAEIKSKGLDSFLAPADDKQKKVRESFFLIKDARGRAIGFTMEVLSSHPAEKPQNEDILIDPVPEAQLDILAGGFYYIRGRYNHMQATLFQSDNSFNEFVWKNEISSPTGRSDDEVVLGKDGIMTVKKLVRRAEEKYYQLSPAAIPDILGELLFSQMLDSNQKEILVDIIEANGKITPLLISKIEPPPRSDSQNLNDGVDITSEETTYAFNVQLLDGRGFSERVYLDSQKRISRRLLQQEDVYTFERTSTENILREFPEQSGSISQNKDKAPEQGQPQENDEW